MTRGDRLPMFALTSQTAPWILESQSHGLKGDRHNRRRRRRCEAPAPFALLKGYSNVHVDGPDDPRAFPWSCENLSFAGGFLQCR